MNETNETFITLLNRRGVIALSGNDRRRFLQGLISNDIELCQPDKPIYAALLTPQGKFLHDMFVIDRGDDFLIDCERERADDLVKRLGMYKLRAAIELKNVADDYQIWGAVNAPQLDIPYAYNDPRNAALGQRLILGNNNSDGLKKLQTTAPEKPFENYDRHRLSLGIPDGSRDMLIGQSTLLECNMDCLNAISWTKGCYMGQELTARMHYRALVKKRLSPVKLSLPAPPPETPIYINGIEVGELRSSCSDLALALLKTELAETGDLTLGAENFRVQN